MTLIGRGRRWSTCLKSSILGWQCSISLFRDGLPPIGFYELLLPSSRSDLSTNRLAVELIHMNWNSIELQLEVKMRRGTVKPSRPAVANNCTCTHMTFPHRNFLKMCVARHVRGALVRLYIDIVTILGVLGIAYYSATVSCSNIGTLISRLLGTREL